MLYSMNDVKEINARFFIILKNQIAGPDGWKNQNASQVLFKKRQCNLLIRRDLCLDFCMCFEKFSFIITEE